MTPTCRARLTLELSRGLGLTTSHKLIEALGGAEAVVDAPAAAFERVEGVGKTRAGKARRAIDDAVRDASAEREAERAGAVGASLVCLDDEAFPRLLRLIPDPPHVLWVRGRLDPGDAMSVAIVGSRKCSLYGREQADRFAGQLAEAGLTVVSGGAYGIDKAAHEAALSVRGRTIAVLGSGLGKPYPAPHRPLFDRIVSEDAGAVVSEFAVDAPVVRKNFHRRNRLISGLSLGTLVVEAGRHSGALITARQCVEEHGRELMALPGRVDSAVSSECHRLIREQWATLVTSPADTLDVIGQDEALRAAAGVGEAPPAASVGDGIADAAPGPHPLLSETQRALWEAMPTPRSVDDLAADAGLDVATVRSELTMLQLRGIAESRGGLFVRKR